MGGFRVFLNKFGWMLALSFSLTPVGSSLALVPLDYPGHFSVPIFGETCAVTVGDLDHDGLSEILASRGEKYLTVVEFGPGGPFRRSGVYSVGGRVTGLMMLPDGVTGLGRVGALLVDPDRFVVLQYRGEGNGFDELAVIDLPEDPGGFSLYRTGVGEDAALSVALPGIDSWISIYGSGSEWAVTSILPCGDRPDHIVDLDMDGDGVDEIVIADTGVLSRTLSIFNRDGGGDFHMREQIPTPDCPNGLSVCDQDGDSVKEVFVSYVDSTFISVFSVVDGTLVEAGRIPVTMTLDGLLVTSLGGGEAGLWCWQNANGMIHCFHRTDGVWNSGEHFSSGGRSVSVELGDVNLDGLSDLIVPGGESGKVAVLFGNDRPTLRAYLATHFPGGPRLGVVCDENGDGHLDLIVPACDDGTVEFLYGDGQGHLERRGTILSAGSAPVRVATLYANADTLQDLAVLTPYGGCVEIWCKVVSGEYLQTDEVSIGWNATMMDVVDLDGDSLDDLIVGNPTTDEVLIAWANGVGGFSDPFVISMPSGLGEVVTIDFNGDDLLDLVVSTTGLTVASFPNLGERQFGGLVNTVVGDNTRQMVVVDLDSDGDDDVGVICENGLAMRFLENRSDGTLVLTPEGVDLREICGTVVAADLNLDGHSEVIVTRPVSGGVSILYGTGAFIMPLSAPFPLGELPVGVCVGDFDEDGRPDMVVMDVELNTIVMGLNVDPAPVAAEVFALAADCLAGEVGLFFAVPLDSRWRLELVVDGEMFLIADDEGLRCGRIVGAAAERTLYVTAEDLVALGLGGVLASQESLDFCLRFGAGTGMERTLRAEVFSSCLSGEGVLPAGRWLGEPQPNPFNPRVRIGFSLKRPAAVEAVVWDLAGRRIATLARANYSVGWHELEWDGTVAGRPAGAGTYLVTISADGRVASRKMTLLK